jgi:four helix bundle protein
MEQGKKIESFEDLQVWRLAIDLAASVYLALQQSRDFSFRDQVQKAAVSISSNFAEGFERGSNADFIRFLYYAKGSCGEVRSQLQIARRIQLLAEPLAATLIEEARMLSRKLGAFIKVRETRFS